MSILFYKSDCFGETERTGFLLKHSKSEIAVKVSDGAVLNSNVNDVIFSG